MKKLQKTILNLAKDIKPEKSMSKVFISKRASKETESLLDSIHELLY